MNFLTFHPDILQRIEYSLEMKLTDLYNKVISKEPYNDMDVFFESYESFEEIPLVSRYGRLKHLMDEMSNDGVSDFLTGLALFVLNTLKVLETSTGKDIFSP